jgi:hypothetical protein
MVHQFPRRPFCPLAQQVASPLAHLILPGMGGSSSDKQGGADGPGTGWGTPQAFPFLLLQWGVPRARWSVLGRTAMRGSMSELASRALRVALRPAIHDPVPGPVISSLRIDQFISQRRPGTAGIGEATLIGPGSSAHMNSADTRGRVSTSRESHPGAGDTFLQPSGRTPPGQADGFGRVPAFAIAFLRYEPGTTHRIT